MIQEQVPAASKMQDYIEARSISREQKSIAHHKDCHKEAHNEKDPSYWHFSRKKTTKKVKCENSSYTGACYYISGLNYTRHHCAGTLVLPGTGTW